MEPISLVQAIEELPGPWQPRDVTTVNEAILRLALLEGAFEWHSHDEEELFICWSGRFRIELEEGDHVEMGPGDVFVVPMGVQHRPVADERAHALLLERPETLQYGSKR